MEQGCNTTPLEVMVIKIKSVPVWHLYFQEGISLLAFEENWVLSEEHEKR